jgi:2-polyprenyl-6-methoxyphenol hydroxylase-like FAD-dependent oxidoreductase
MAGMAVAAALTHGFERITVLERDTLPTRAASRTGTPQDRHLHLLLPSGAAALEQLLPGLGDDLVAAGAVAVTRTPSAWCWAVTA